MVTIENLPTGIWAISFPLVKGFWLIFALICSLVSICSLFKIIFTVSFDEQFLTLM